ncbi:hypothetical protein B0J13DRAFT_524986 [Dactylonectria estremocensis]|uniref:Uncharacterized protein n=1 Tax=Dactylonectria estremocensis TaxID=1079267 RepID=A0A9P9ER34_9HYPO|nr:hypothetical protein B0J13DRAFT_524986 [Dactylonectria estremocensis]
MCYRLSALGSSSGAANNSSTLSDSKTEFFSGLSNILLLDTSSQYYWESDLVAISLNDTAVNNYYDCLQKGWFGQAIRERYAFDGQVLDNGTVNGTDMLIDDLILSESEEYLEENDDRIAESQVAFRQAVAWNATDTTLDPGRDLLEKIFQVFQEYSPLVKRSGEYETTYRKKVRSL